MIIPDAVRPQYFANLISGLAMHVVGPYSLRLVFQGFVVLVGALILSGAVNTADRRRQRRVEPHGGRRRSDPVVQEAATASSAPSTASST